MTRIIGVGSPFGADRLGWEAIDHLVEVGLDGCELIKLDRPGSGLLSWFDGADRLILIDAVLIDEGPGGASLFELGQLESYSSTTSSHGFGVAQAIDLARELNQLPCRLRLVGIHTGADPSTAPPLDTPGLESLIHSLLQCPTR
jgi:hydrogenase maturation protease